MTQVLPVPVAAVEEIERRKLRLLRTHLENLCAMMPP
jgi:hypothetical protein